MKNALGIKYYKNKSSFIKFEKQNTIHTIWKKEQKLETTSMSCKQQQNWRKAHVFDPFESDLLFW